MSRRTTFLLIAFVLSPMLLEAVGLARPEALGLDIERRTRQALPIGLHLAGALAFPTLGALQIAGWFRRRHRVAHRRIGWALAVLGTSVGASALWLNQIHPPVEGSVKGVAVALMAAYFLVALALGITAARRGDIATHRRWMLRAYALTVAPACQLVIGLALMAALGPLAAPVSIASHFAGWALPMLLVERLIRRRPAVPRALAA